MPSWYDNLIYIKAEGKLRKYAKEFCQQSLSVQSLEVLASRKARLADIPSFKQMIQADGLQKVSEENRKGIQYLLGLPEDKLLGLLESDLPDHVAVLRRYPGYGSQILHDIVRMLAAA